MQELTKSVSRQDANFKLSPSSSNETSINLSKEISALISDESCDVTFTIYKDDFIKAIGALCLLKQVYLKKETTPSTISSIYNSLSKQVSAQFGDNSTSAYTIKHLKRDDGRSYFNDLKRDNGFNLRAFLVEQYSFLSFIKEDNGSLTLRVETILPTDELPGKPVDAIEENNNEIDCPLQQIYFGAPGTGKSHRIKQVCREYEHFRITFHPDTDYASFVGSYKPITHSEQVYTNMGDKAIALKDSVTGEPITTTKITYQYVYQAFLNAYIAAWRQQQNENPLPVFLVIEEINRGNCAQIFGDIFQLLDRNESGFSDYPIIADNDLKKELAKEFESLDVHNAENINGIYNDDIIAKIKSGSHLLLPNNLYIWATMNTSDQSLFPIDSAFKRRWDWKYVKIADSGKDYRIAVNNNEYDWWEFVNAINIHIGNDTDQEDKKLGYFFAKGKKNDEGKYIISADTFLSKVIFFIYNDVYKDFGFDDDIFKDENGEVLTFANYFNQYGDTVPEKVERFIRNLGLQPLQLTEAEEEAQDEVENQADFTNDGSSNKLTIRFPDGTIIRENTRFESYLKALERIGLERVEPIAAEKKYTRRNSALVSTSESPEVLADPVYTYVKSGDYYVIKGTNTKTQKNMLNLVSDRLNLDLIVTVE